MTEVWLARRGESGDVARLLIAFRDWLESSTPVDASMIDSVSRLFDDPNTEYLLGRGGSGDPASGVCQLRFRHSVWTGSPDCWLEDLYVDDTARGRGVGRALVELAFQRARLRGAARIELDTNESNATAIALYESMGFSARSKAHGHLQGRDLFLGRELGLRRA